MAGRRLAELATRPLVVDFLDLALSHGHPAFALEEIVIGDDSPLLTMTVALATILRVVASREAGRGPGPD